MRRIINMLLMASTIFFIGCAGNVMPNKGETIINIDYLENSSTGEIQKSVSIIENRITNFISPTTGVLAEVNGQSVEIQVKEEIDSLSLHQLLTRNRMMRICYAVEVKNYDPIRTFLTDYISIPTKSKPYKPNSMIGLVDEANKAQVEKIIDSPGFKKSFPTVSEMYWGVKKMEGKYALFLASTTSSYIDETMYVNVGAHKNEEEDSGILSFKLKDDFIERIGLLTGNDSTYLLHVFHDNVYISKIIKPHLTQADFGMEGAFSPLDAKVLAALWGSEELSQNFTIKNVETSN